VLSTATYSSSGADCSALFLVVLVARQQGPADPRILVSQCHCSDVFVAPLCDPADPLACRTCRLSIGLVWVIDH